MERQRSTISSFPETFDFDHGSSSNSTGVDQQIPWNNMQNPVGSRLPDYILNPADTNITNENVVSHDGRSLSGLNLDEHGSSETTGNRIAHDDIEMDHGWLSSLSFGAGASLREGRQYDPTNILSLESVNISLNSNQAANGPLYCQNSNSDGMPQNVDLNVGYISNRGNGGQVTEAGLCPHPYKSGGLETEQIPYASGSSDPFGTASGIAGYLMEENDGGSGSSSGNWRLSCKRKAFEGAFGQSSLGGSSSCFQQAGSSAWHGSPAHHNASSSLGISTHTENAPDVSPLEHLNPRLRVGMRGVAFHNILAPNVSGNAESSQRNFRMRINPAHQQDSVPPNPLSTRSAARHSHVWSPHQSSRLIPNHSLDSRSRAATTNISPQSQSNAMHVPGLSQHVQHFPWDGVSNSRAGSSSSSPIISGERGAALQEEAHSRSMLRNISEHSMFIPATEMRNLAQDTTNWSLANGNISIPGNIASTSRTSSSSGAQSLPTPTWVPHPNPPTQNSLRLSDFAESISNISPLRSGTGLASSEMVISSGLGHQGRRESYLRSAFLMERHGVLGAPYSLRTSAAASEGRSRLLSEIRNVLDLMRRGESVGFEDVLILDRSIIYGVADLHDRHRDMRLDVDNMSYEEILALEERIGNVNTGLSEDTINKCLRQQKYLSIKMGAPSEVEPCCICQEEYVDGQDLGMLDCGHDFHTGCVKQWLMHKNLCPICKTTALVT